MARSSAVNDDLVWLANTGAAGKVLDNYLLFTVQPGQQPAFASISHVKTAVPVNAQGRNSAGELSHCIAAACVDDATRINVKGSQQVQVEVKLGILCAARRRDRTNGARDGLDD